MYGREFERKAAVTQATATTGAGERGAPGQGGGGVVVGVGCVVFVMFVLYVVCGDGMRASVCELTLNYVVFVAELTLNNCNDIRP